MPNNNKVQLIVTNQIGYHRIEKYQNISKEGNSTNQHIHNLITNYCDKKCSRYGLDICICKCS